MKTPDYHGACLCGAVTYTICGPLTEANACHCEQCRKWTGHFLVSVDVPRDQLEITSDEHLAWFASSEKVRRGFCARCGASMFFDPIDTTKHNWIAVALGTLANTSTIQVNQHIFVSEKGDYYEILDGAKQNAR